MFKVNICLLYVTEQQCGNFQECPPIKHQRANVNIFRKHSCTQYLSGTCQLLLEVFPKKDTEMHESTHKKRSTLYFIIYYLHGWMSENQERKPQVLIKMATNIFVVMCTVTVKVHTIFTAQHSGINRASRIQNDNGDEEIIWASMSWTRNVAKLLQLGWPLIVRILPLGIIIKLFFAGVWQ